VEEGPAAELFARPKTAYARALLDAIPRLDRADRGGRPTIAPVPPDAPVLAAARDVKVWFPMRAGLFARRKMLRAVDGVSFDVREGETLGIVGESGSGKSTLARAVLNLIPASAGAVTLMGRELSPADQAAIRASRRDLQIVFQDPLASLDPRMTVGASIAEPLTAFRPELGRAARETEARGMMEQVELDPALINRYPHELSGGQNQRVGIARAMILRPRLVICDEAVSALDVGVRAQIIDLLIQLQKAMGLSMIFISHDLAVVREISHRVLVMYLGRVLETADRDRIWQAPQHPYTKALISAAPIPDPAIERARQRVKPPGEPGVPILAPELKEVAPGHLVADFDA
jgi:ABC-type microcin C transport system duplicated ATPase subunit YejF